MAYRIALVRSQVGLETTMALNKVLFRFDDFEGPESGNVLWLATDATGEAVGFASIRPTIDHPEMAFLSRAGVLSGHRRNGLHKRLIRVRERWARWVGYESIWTYTALWNIKSQRSLVRGGYLPWKPWWAVADTIYFQKELS